ncbi:MAG TPA: flagellar basal body L-ring protein FlgH [Rhodobacterales bacterium]|nr:flagellar basal body L-ring protein FlgH [Rhodobacterales bacterium]
MTTPILKFGLAIIAISLIAGCENRLDDLGRLPTMTSVEGTREAQAMNALALPRDIAARRDADGASLWAAGRQSLLGDRRAQQAGDILTVVIEIDDKAEFSASSKRGRTGSEEMSVGTVFGFEEKAPLSELTLSPGLSTNSASSAAGDGSTRRNEKLTLRIAATVLGTLPNGILQIQGSQEVRVNYELRELNVSGYVRPEDISRQNEIAYDKIASARISYGGRGQISQMQQPRYGQQLTDIVLPF